MRQVRAMGELNARKAALLADVNVGIKEVAASSPSDGLDWEFFCECGDADCHEMVTLSVEAFSALRDGGGHVLAPGHHDTVVARAEHAGDLAEDLRDSAKALKAQRG